MNRFKIHNMKGKIIAAIADWIDENEGDLTASAMPSEHKDEIAELIYAAIEPMIAEKDYQLKELFDHMENEHGLTLLDTELGDIIHIARGK